MARLAAAWNRFWFDDVGGTPFALARVGIALAGMQLWFGMVPLMRQFYSDAGEFPIAEARTWSAEWVARFLMPDVLGGYAASLVIFVAWGVALAALALGWRTRLAAWVNWILFVWLFHRNLFLANGGDEVFRLASLYLALGYTVLPAERRALTLDRRRAAAAGVPADPRMSAWPLRFIQVQIALVYLVAGFWKLVGPPWWDGSALHIALANPTFSRFGAPDWAWLHLPYLVLGLAVSWWEFLFPALALMPRARLWSLAFGVVLHGAILALMNIGVFPFVMLGCYPAFLKEHEARRVVAMIGRRLRLRPQPKADRSASAPSGVVG
jgi:hypothetical protein